MKRRLRAEIKRRLASLTLDERREKSAAIEQRFLNLAEFSRARTVMLFASMPDEVDTTPIIAEALRLGKRVALPRCKPATRELEAVEIADPDRDLKTGFYGLREPTGSRLIPSNELDLILVPGLAFDRAGHRLGRGAGYYDRFLAGLTAQARRVSICFDCQLIADVPHGSHDQDVQAIITENEAMMVASA